MVWLHHLTNISIFILDIWLVPVLTSLTIPYLALKLFAKHHWKSLTIIIGYLSLPFLSLHLTTPHNLVIFLSLIVVLLALKKDTSPFTILMPALASALTHPLIGIPTVLFATAYILFQKYQRKIIWVVLLGLQSLTVPMLFILNNIRSGAGAPTLSNPIYALQSFFALFSLPYWYERVAPLHLQMLYSYERLIPLLLVCFALIGLWQKRREQRYILYITTSIGFVASAWLIRSWIVFPDVVNYEQRDFPLRLVKAAGLFLFPLAVIGFATCIEKITALQKLQAFVPFALGGVLMVTLYLTYPQVNAKVHFPGFNVTSADIEAVHVIAQQEEVGSYIVLSNQLTAAAALKEYSFQTYHQTTDGSEHFYYAIPTGGKLYNEYLKFLYEGQKRTYIESAMNYAQVNTAYVLVSDFWKNAEAIIDNAKETADSTEQIQNGNITILRYVR